MSTLTCKNSVVSRLSDRTETFSAALALSFAVVGLDQFLHTSPAQIGTSVAFQLLRWVSDSLMALPLFVAGVWLGHLVADRAGLRLSARAEVFTRALLISGMVALFLVPGWFAYNGLASLTQSTGTATTAHVHGANRGPDAYWVANPVVLALLLAPPAAAVVWAVYRVASRRLSRLPRAAGWLVRGSAIAALLGGVSTVAFFLHQAANRADSSQVYYTSALQFAHVHSHAFFANGHRLGIPLAGPPVTSAPFAFAYQLARALQDGIIAQVVGLPIAALMLLWAARTMRDQDRHKHEGSHLEEVATR